MPLTKYIKDGMAPEVARAMVDAFATVTNRLNELGHETSPTSIAQKLSTLIHEGETDAVKLAEAVLAAFIPRT